MKVGLKDQKEYDQKKQIDDIDNAFIKDDEYPAKKNVEKNEEQTRKRKSVLDINTVNSILAKASIKVIKGEINSGWSQIRWVFWKSHKYPI